MLSPFAMHTPATVAEASDMLLQLDGETALYAGGTELLILIKERLAYFSHLIDIKHIPGLAGISLDDAGGSISIGPLASHRSLEISATIRDHAPLLAELEAQVANIRVRHAGTIGGNLCFAEPHSDPATLFVAWDAELTLSSAAGSRIVQANDFFIGLLETAREPGELLTKITIPVMPAGTGSSYRRFKTHERPTAAVAVVLTVRQNEISDARVVAGSVGLGPERLSTVEQMLTGNRPGPDLFGQAASAVGEAAFVENEGFESADYKRHLLSVLTTDALQEAAERAA